MYFQDEILELIERMVVGVEIDSNGVIGIRLIVSGYEMLCME